jgi:hypothetical protein
LVINKSRYTNNDHANLKAGMDKYRQRHNLSQSELNELLSHKDEAIKWEQSSIWAGIGMAILKQCSANHVVAKYLPHHMLNSVLNHVQTTANKTVYREGRWSRAETVELLCLVLEHGTKKGRWQFISDALMRDPTSCRNHFDNNKHRQEELLNSASVESTGDGADGASVELTCDVVDDAFVESTGNNTGIGDLQDRRFAVWPFG